MKKLILILIISTMSLCCYSAIDFNDIKQVADGDPAAAIEVCETALASNPSDMNARKWLAYLYYKTGRYEDSLKVSSETDAEDPSLPNYAGLSCIALGKYQDAVMFFDRAIILDKDWYEPYNNKGIAYNALKQYQAAKNAFLSAYNIQAAQKDPSLKNVTVYVNYAASLANLQDYKGALKIYGYAEKLRPEERDVLLGKAETLFRMGDYSAALDAYKTVLAKDPKDIQVCRGIGNCYMMKKETAEALKYFDMALESEADYETFFNAGLACRNAGQFGNAVKYFAKAAEIRPDDYEALNELGWSEYKSGSNENALTHIKSSLEKKADYLPAMLNLASYYSGTGDHANAYAEWSRISMQVPDNPSYRVNLGNECHNTGRYQEALEQYQEAIRLDPKTKGAYYGLGTTCIAIAVKNNNETAMFNRALDSFAKAIEAEADNPNIYINQAVALQYLGRYAEAIAANEKALKLSPKNELALRNLENLRKAASN